MHGDFLADLALVMLVAGVVTVIFHRLRQPVVLGYLIAGVIVGPYTDVIPLQVIDKHSIDNLSSLGIVLLMFGLGLHFSLRKLANVGATALIAATLEIAVMSAAGYGLGRAFGWSPMDSLFLGAILSISSTTIIIKALQELGLQKQRFAELIFGILIVEDVLAIAMMAILSGVAVKNSVEVGATAVVLGKLGIFLVATLVIGLLAVPPLLRYVARFRSNEMLLVTVLGLCFGVSLLAIKMGYSEALGAFLIGAIVAEAREKGRIEILIEPVRDMFSAIFFVAIGMLIQPKMLVEYAWPIALITTLCVVGKVVACGLGTFLSGHGPRTSMRVGMGLAQIGEFSFIIATLGYQLKVTSEFLYPIAVTVSAITTLLTPYLIRYSDNVATGLGRMLPRNVSAAGEVYTDWVNGIGASGRGTRMGVRQVLRKLLLQMGLNMMLVTGLFIVAAWSARHFSNFDMSFPAWTGGAKAVFWLSAAILSMPLLIVTIRKLRAVSIIVSEVSVPKAVAGENTATRRVLVAGGVRVIGLVLLATWVAALTAAVLPPWPVLVTLIVVAGLVMALRWRAFERVYGRAQLALRETLTPTPDAHAGHAESDVENETAAPASTILRNAALDEILLPATSPANGKLIRELELRTRTGATAVGIERAGLSVINPGPDEELLAGDRLLLLGSREQVDQARVYLLGDGVAAAN